jgi:hypothetical protein
MATTHGNVTVTTNPTLIIGANPNRRAIIISNNTNTSLYLSPDSSLTTANGIVVPALGHIEISADGEVFKGDIYGIVAASTNDVRYWEWTP